MAQWQDARSLHQPQITPCKQFRVFSFFQFFFFFRFFVSFLFSSPFVSVLCAKSVQKFLVHFNCLSDASKVENFLLFFAWCCFMLLVCHSVATVCVLLVLIGACAWPILRILSRIVTRLCNTVFNDALTNQKFFVNDENEIGRWLTFQSQPFDWAFICSNYGDLIRRWWNYEKLTKLKNHTHTFTLLHTCTRPPLKCDKRRRWRNVCEKPIAFRCSCC